MNYKKITAFALAIITIMSMSACNKSNAEPNDTNVITESVIAADDTSVTTSETGDTTTALKSDTTKYYQSKLTHKNSWSDCYYLYEYDDNGNVLIETMYNTSDDSIVQKMFHEYDNNNNEILYKSFDADGNETDLIVNTYDTNGNRTSSIIYYYDRLTYKQEFSYDDNGRVLKLVETSDVDVVINECTYDNNGYEIKRETYVAQAETPDDFTMLGYVMNTYDDNGNRLECISYFNDSTVEFGYKTEYNADNKQTKGYTVNVNGAYILSSEYEYDSNGNCTKAMEYSLDGDTDYIRLYTYDDNGNLLTEKYMSDDNLMWYQESVYNADNLRLSVTGYDENMAVANKRVYEYDEYGNCILDTSYDENGEVIETITTEFIAIG